MLVWYMATLGTAEVIAGDLAAAKQVFRELLTMSYAADDQMALGAAIIGLGFVASGEGRHERLARLWGVDARLRQEAGGGPLRAIRDRLGDPEAAARLAIGDAVFEQRRAEGRGDVGGRGRGVRALAGRCGARLNDGGACRCLSRSSS